MLVPVVTALKPFLQPTSLITADAGYHSKDNLLALQAMNVAALIADNQMRQRDARFETQRRHLTLPSPLHNKNTKPTSPPRYQPSDFTYDEHTGSVSAPPVKPSIVTGVIVVLMGRRLFVSRALSVTAFRAAIDPDAYTR